MEHNGDCQCERCFLLDEIATLAQELSECVVGKICSEHILPTYWGKREKQKALIKRLQEVNHQSKN